MIRTAFVLGALSLAGISLAGPTNPGSIPAPELAKSVLRKFLDSNERIALNAIVVRQECWDEDVKISFKVQQDAHGRRKMVAIGPLSMQGMISIDDGHQWFSYDPDMERMVVMPSPRAVKADTDRRLALAAQNYRFAVETNVQVAGRPATVIVAIPRNPVLPTRKISVDQANEVLLRVEAIERSGEKNVLFDTKMIQFSAPPAPPAAFRIEPDKPVRVVRPEPPQAFTSAPQAKGLSGFTPYMPTDLPFGFSVQNQVVAGSASSRFVAIRMTDGLANATLYQFRKGTQPLGPDTDRMDRTVGAVTFRLIGDVPSNVRRAMMESITKGAARTFRLVREPNAVETPLPPKREPQRVAGTIGTNGTKVVEPPQPDLP